MPCPVCHKEEIDAELRICPNCGTDLELYSYIGGLETSKKKNKKLKIVFMSLSIILLSAFLLFYRFRYKKMLSMGNGKNEVEMALLTKENAHQKKEISKLKDEVKELHEKQINQPINPSTHQPINSSTSKPISPSTHQPINPSTSQRINPSTHQPINPSTHQPLNSSTGKYKTHIVKEGETAFGIARTYYGNGIHYPKIVRDNNLRDATFIRIGMELKIYDLK